MRHWERWFRGRNAVLAVAMISAASSSAGCGDEASSASGTAAALSAVPTVAEFAVLAARRIDVGDRSTIAAGHLGVAAGSTNSLTAGIDSRVGVGEILLAPTVTLGDRTNAGAIGANRLNLGSGAVTGRRSGFIAPPPAPVPGAVTAGTTAVTVNGTQTRSLAPGRYGVVTVNGTLNLSGGLYEVQSLRLGPDARVAAAADSTIRVATGIAAGDRAVLVGAGASGAGGLHLIVAGTIDGPTNSLSLGVDVQLTAIVVARGGFRAGDRLRARGAISARDVVIANDSTVTFDDGFGCSSNAACDDGNPCTVDACIDAACSSTSAPNGSTCNDGDICTQTSSCQGGVCVGGSPILCTASDPCHLAGVCDRSTGVCSRPIAPDGTACSDGDACTQTDTCQAGACTGGNPIDCIASDQCHVPGTCDPATGACTNPESPNGTLCEDGDVCTRGDRCNDGRCAPGPAIVTEYPSGLPSPRQITKGPDGNLWFVSTEASPGVGAIARIVPSTGAITAYLTNAAPRETAVLVDDVVAAADGNLWFTGRIPSLGDLPTIGSLTPSGVFIAPDLNGSPGGAIAAGPDGNLWTGGSFLGVIDVVFRTSSPGVAIAVENTPRALTAGPDANVWFVASSDGSAFVGRVVPNLPGFEELTKFPVTTGGDLNDITGGPDGNLWFTDAGQNDVVRITPSGAMTRFAVPTPGSGVFGIVAGPDGNLWFTEQTTNKLGRITSAGVITELACLAPSSGPTSITNGPDGRLWFTESSSGKIAVLTLP